MKYYFAAVHESVVGTFETSADVRYAAAFGGKADIGALVALDLSKIAWLAATAARATSTFRMRTRSRHEGNVDLRGP
jgi:hypothetical protein